MNSLNDVINIPFNCVLNGNSHDSSIIDEYRARLYKTDKSLVSDDSVFNMYNINDLSSMNSFGRFDIVLDSLLIKCCYIESILSDYTSYDNNKMLFVSYSGARNRNNSGTYKFPRWSYYKLRNAAFLGIDDPMYTKFPDLLLGWYYGTKDICYIDHTIKIISALCNSKQIAINNCIFFSSSGGGYASILAAISVPNTLSISINPQLYINTHEYAKSFFHITNIDLDTEDKLLRNNLAKKNICL